MKTITWNLNVAWLFAILLSTVSVQGMEHYREPEHDVIINQSEIDKALLLPLALSIAGNCGGVLFCGAGIPVLGWPMILYGIYQIATLPDQAASIVALKQAAKQSKCCICYEGPDDGIRIIMDIPCINIHPDHICVECYQGILQKNAKCPQCRGVLRNVLEI